MSPSIGQWSSPLIEVVTIPEDEQVKANQALDRQPDAEQLRKMLGLVTA